LTCTNFILLLTDGSKDPFDEDLIFSLEPDRVVDSFSYNSRKPTTSFQHKQPIVVREIPIQRIRATTTTTTFTLPGSALEDKDEKSKLQRRSTSSSDIHLRQSKLKSNTLPVQVPNVYKNIYSATPK